MCFTPSMTTRQQAALDLIDREGVVSPRRLAGEYGLRSQDAGRTLRSLERHGVVEFWTGIDKAGEWVADAGYRRPPTTKEGTTSQAADALALFVDSVFSQGNRGLSDQEHAQLLAHTNAYLAQRTP